ncbi:MAG: hypothetical protein KC925_00785 [Candidatus Doudnabacteria bacterium]|nr:hypothetical protein [Candidatus Doudnabacteria bacterium]MCA9387697.1 hypothetical protein [Candidatus Andersenbacteria bacterium]
MATETQTTLETLKQNITVGDVPELSASDIFVQWKANEYEPISLDRRQLTLGVLLAAVLLIISIATANFLFTIVIVLASVAIYLFLNREPRVLDVALTSKGIIYGDRFLSYANDLRLFWILYDPPLSVLKLSQTGFTTPTLDIQLGTQDPIEVRDILLTFLDEDIDAEEHTADRFSRRIGF